MRQCYAYDYGHTYEPATSEKTSLRHIFLTLNPLIKSPVNSRRSTPFGVVLPSSLAIRVMLRKTGFCTKPEIIDYKVGQSSSSRIKSNRD